MEIARANAAATAPATAAGTAPPATAAGTGSGSGSGVCAGETAIWLATMSFREYGDAAATKVTGATDRAI